VAASLHKKGIRLVDFAETLTKADFVSVHCPLQASTRNLIGAEALALMKPTAFLINMARGGIVDEQALLHALVHNKSPAGAALDVHQAEGEGKVSALASLPNVVLTPHIGATTVDTQREIGERILAAIESFPSNSHAHTIGVDVAANNVERASHSGSPKPE
jgi:phosphoglycerate dehydrogenase-like enzyme